MSSGTVNHEIEAPAIACKDAGAGCVGEPLLRHDLALGSDCFAGDADPGSLHHFGATGQEARSGASEGVVAKGVDWSPASRVGPAAVGAERERQP